MTDNGGMRPSGSSLFWFLSAAVGLGLHGMVRRGQPAERGSRVASWILWAMLAGAVGLAVWAWFF